jgi:signal peptidase II
MRAVPEMSGSLTRVLLGLAMLGTIGCDHLTKHVAGRTLANGPELSYLADTIRLGYVENPGGFLGLGATLPPLVRTWVFSAATGALLVVLLVLLLRRRWEGWAAIGLTLFAAGGISNWLDRVADGEGTVVDFLNVGIGSLRTGIFNVADVAIMAGAAVFVFAELRAARTVVPRAEVCEPGDASEPSEPRSPGH